MLWICKQDLPINNRYTGINY